MGGDKNLDRIKKALYLYKNSYSISNKLLLTGLNEKNKYNKILYKIKRHKFVLDSGIEKKNIVFAYNTKNTFNELIYIRNYAKNHKYHTVLIVTDPPHSRRINILIKLLKYKNYTINYIIVSSNPVWWKKFPPYININSLAFVISEYIKIVHNFCIYYLLKYK